MSPSLQLPKEILATLRSHSFTWLVTGGAGFIGSHIVEQLLRLSQTVVCLDNFSTGTRHNLREATASLTPQTARSLRLISGDVRDLQTCLSACQDVDFVLHQAAISSIPASLESPHRTHETNATGTFNIMEAARLTEVRSVVYASSSSIYGNRFLDRQQIKPSSPYAASKLVGETYAALFSHLYALPTTGLRYFNVYGPRQDDSGSYSAVIPSWIKAACQEEPAVIYGDGATSRDFIFVHEVVAANILAALRHSRKQSPARIFDIGTGSATTLAQLHALISGSMAELNLGIIPCAPVYRPRSDHDLRHSLADPCPARDEIGFSAKTNLDAGLTVTAEWYCKTKLVASHQKASQEAFRFEHPNQLTAELEHAEA